jgi:hypothetical protein
MTARSAVALLALSFLSASCGAVAEPKEGERTRAVSAPIIKGTDSTPDQNAVVLVMHYDAMQIGGAAAGCSGTLLTPRLVLTARHCVATTDPTAACDSDGNATFGGVIHDELAANKLFAFVGTRRPDFLAGLDQGARGKEIIDDGAKTLCNHDLALILLDRPLPGAKIAPLRLLGKARPGERVRVIGWGITDTSPEPTTRQQRAGVPVLRVGPGPELGAGELVLGESGCAGDSGGPALSEETGAVVGLLSRGGNGSSAPGADACLGGENIYTSPASFKDLILGAYQKAGQAPWLEGEPDPTTLPPPAPVVASPSYDASSGCATAGACPSPRGSWAWLAVGAALAACAARRRRSAG